MQSLVSGVGEGGRDLEIVNSGSSLGSYRNSFVSKVNRGEPKTIHLKLSGSALK